MNILSAINGSKFSAVNLPFGMALTDNQSKISYFGGGHITNMTYASKNGLIVWTEDGLAHEFAGNVVARMNSSYRLCVNGTEGAMQGAFDAVCVFAITPAGDNLNQMRIALLQAVTERTIH